MKSYQFYQYIQRVNGAAAYHKLLFVSTRQESVAERSFILNWKNIRQPTCATAIKVKMFHAKSAIFSIFFVVLLKESLQTPVNGEVNISMDMSCVLETTCVDSVATKVVRALKTRTSVDFGIFSIEPVKNFKVEEGRSMSKLWDFMSSNALRIPFGSYSVNLQKSTEKKNGLDLSVTQAFEGTYCCTKKMRNLWRICSKETSESSIHKTFF